MLLTWGGGGVKYKVVYFAHLMLGVSGGMLPQEILKFRPSEITSGAFSSNFTLSMNGPYHWCKNKIWQPSFKGG